MRRLAWCLLLLSTAAATGEPILVTSDKQLSRYWLPAPELMGAAVPPAARGLHAVVSRHGRIDFSFEVTIGADGVPSDLRVLSIAPAGIDPAPFVAWQLFQRWRPAAGNAARVPVRARLSQPQYLPASRRDQS